MRIIAVTPAGRKKYLSILSRYILNDTDIDEWQIWLNTEIKDDIDYIKNTLAKHSKVQVVEIPHKFSGPQSYRIRHFFPTAINSECIYVRLDDDIVYYEKGSIGRLAQYRIANPNYFLVYGNVFNSGLSSHIQQRHCRIPLSYGECKYICMDNVSWKSPEFAEKLHRLFLADPTPAKWHINDWLLYHYERHSINVISWFGSDANLWSSNMDQDEEDWLACVKPKRDKRPNVIYGDGLFCHYAFYTQREHLAKTDILSQYDKLSLQLNPAV